MGGRWYAPHKSGSTILCAAKADRARRWGGSPHTHSCEAEPAGRVEPSGRGGGGPGKPRAAVRGDMWRGHGGGDGAVLGARSAHCSAEKGLMSGVFGPSSSRTVLSVDSAPFPLCQTLCRFCDYFFAFLSFRSRSLGSFRLGFYDLVHTDLSFLGLTYTGSQLSTSSRSLPPCTT